MTDEQKKLDNKFWEAIIHITVVIEKARGRDVEDFDRLRTAKENFLAVYNDWKIHLGDPMNILPSVKADWLRELANAVEHGEIDL